MSTNPIPPPGLYDGYYKYDQAVAEAYEADRRDESHWQLEDDFVAGYFRDLPVAGLLDLPVGTGRFFGHYRHVRHVTGVDISPEMLAQAEKKSPQLPPGTTLQLEKGDVLALRFGDREFDHAIVWRLVHLLPPDLLRPAVRELCRVTAGKIVLQSYASRRRKEGLYARVLRRSGAVLGRFLPARRKASPPSPARVVTPWSHIQSYGHSQEVLDALFAECGFSVLSGKILEVYRGDEVRATVYGRVAAESALPG